MVHKGVLRPASYDDIRSVWEEPNSTVKIDPEDEGLYKLADMAGWKTLKAHINNMKGELDKKLSLAVANGMSEAEIGKSTVVTVLVKECLDSLVNKVEDSALIVEQIKNEQARSDTK